MADFLLELLSEEIPARMQAKAAADLARLFAEEIARSGLAAHAIETFATPRRLALIARGLPLETAAVSEETKGPRASAPPQALEGFLRKTGLSREQLVERDGVLFAVVEKPGRDTKAVLAEAIPAVIRAFPWPKSMRWGAASASTESLRWVRPLQGIVAILGEDLVEIEVAGVKSGFVTLGHRFHHPLGVTIGSAADYAAKLRACHVIVDPAERQAIIREQAAAAAAAEGLTVVPDEGLVAENAGLTEWPVPLLGSFDRAFLDVPREVIQLTMRTNQKYFALTDANGDLAPNFICTANIEAADGGAAIVAGNRKVLAARLSDAKFFWEQDLKVPLADQAAKLDKIVFHEKLGTVADKVERVAKLARWLVEEGIVGDRSSPARGGGPSQRDGGGGGPQATASPAEPPLHHPADGPPPRSGKDLAALAYDSAKLAKADLVTGMVGEFPELQGVMGGYYARAQGLPDAVADAIRDHYKPVGQGDEVPTAPVTVAVSLADKLDTLTAFFYEGMAPTGSKDPFALRRQALAVLSILQANGIRLPLATVFIREMTVGAAFRAGFAFGFDTGDLETRAASLGFVVSPEPESTEFSKAKFEAVRIEIQTKVAAHGPQLLDFFADRLKVQQREAGVRHDLIDAVFALGGEDDLVRLLARVKALQAFVTTEDGANLLAGYKRAANILRIEEKKEAPAPLSRPSPTSDEGVQAEEAALIAALDTAEPAAVSAVAAEDFAGAMSALARLRAPIDAFFDKVTVNDADPAKRAARLALLGRIRDAVHRVADFSKIEG